MTTEDNQFDELIFDYLEGNMSSEEAEVFEARLSGSDELQSLVVVWRKTYIIENFSATKDLERDMIRPERRGWNFSLNSFLLIVITVCYWFGTAYQEAHPVDHSITLIPHEIDSPREKVSEKCVIIAVPDVATTTGSLPTENLMRDSQWTAPMDQLLSVEPKKESSFPAPLVIDFRLFLKVEPHVSKFIKPLRISNKRQLTRKDIREINRRKKKTRWQKFRREFFMGGRPNVISLNENF